MTIQGPAPLCEQYLLEANYSTRVDALRLQVAPRHDYSNPVDIDLRWNNTMLLANKALGHYGIRERDLIIVAERICMSISIDLFIELLLFLFLASRLEPVKKRKASIAAEVEFKPFYSPKFVHKQYLVQQDEQPLPYDRLDDDVIGLRRSESMPDLSLSSPEVKRKNDSFRKISAPVGMRMGEFRKYEPLKHLPNILS